VAGDVDRQPMAESGPRSIEDDGVVYVGRRLAPRRDPGGDDDNGAEKDRPEKSGDQKPLRANSFEVFPLDDRPELSHVRSSPLRRRSRQPFAGRSGAATAGSFRISAQMRPNRLSVSAALAGLL